MQFLKKTKITFMRYKFVALALSGTIVIAGILNFTMGKGITQGIDFQGGALIRVIFSHQVPIEDVRSALSEAGITKSRIQEMGTSGREFVIRAMPEAEMEEQEIEEHELLGRVVVGLGRH